MTFAARLACLISNIATAAICILLTIVYFEGVSLPYIGQVIDGAIANRLEGYVTLSEKTAADAKAAELKRQADAAKSAAEQFRQRTLEAERAETVAQADLEKEIAANEKRLADAKRACLLDDGDVDFFMRHR